MGHILYVGRVTCRIYWFIFRVPVKLGCLFLEDGRVILLDQVNYGRICGCSTRDQNGLTWATPLILFSPQSMVLCVQGTISNSIRQFLSLIDFWCRFSGSQGIFQPGNWPGGVSEAASTTTSTSIYIFGGFGYDTPGNGVTRNFTNQI